MNVLSFIYYSLIIWTFRAFPTLCHYKFCCSCHRFILICICIFVYLLGWNSRSRISGSKDRNIFSSLVPYRQIAFRKASYYCPGCVRTLRSVFRRQPSYFSSLLMPQSPIGTCFIFLGSWSQVVSCILMSLIKMSVVSIPRGEFYSWLESPPIMEAKALEWAVEEIFGTGMLPCALISFDGGQPLILFS